MYTYLFITVYIIDFIFYTEFYNGIRKDGATINSYQGNGEKQTDIMQEPMVQTQVADKRIIRAGGRLISGGEG